VTLKLEEFADTAATSYLCRTMNDVFDLLNARRTESGNKKKCPWTIHNLEEKSSILTKFAQDMRQWKYGTTGQLLSKSKRKTCVLGFTAAIHSNLQIASTVLKREENHMSYFCPYLTQQDFLEHFFSRIRQKCGINTNPDFVQVNLIYMLTWLFST
jgi:hypothetical protein